ncbi:hypothetical protein [Rhodopirellula halodulae]|uniref:hypothetical protein n=1 Tax=Rhodopirellula halodulae TaxID=2894198 RepID=UPI001E28FBC7|nr:hypothetical protein [Rhodopirellula sp. JC737]MCC9658830.1 hypothetical protein [Rhodopirellula sp. JC737]
MKSFQSTLGSNSLVTPRLAVIASLVFLTSDVVAWELPVGVSDLARESDWGVVASTRSVTRLLPSDADGSLESPDADYQGPTSVAVFRINDVWKRSDNTCTLAGPSFHVVSPRFIMVACEYDVESRSSPRFLPECDYVLFLRELDENFFSLVNDQSSAHEVRHGMVHTSAIKEYAKFQRVRISEFKTSVLDRSLQDGDQQAPQTSDASGSQ